MSTYLRLVFSFSSTHLTSRYRLFPFQRRDYNIISCSIISSRLAAIALDPNVRPKIVQRNVELANTNRLILEEWVAKQGGRLAWTVPNAGTTALLNLGEGAGKHGDDVKFCKELFEETGVVSLLPILTKSRGGSIRVLTRPLSCLTSSQMVVPAGLCFGVKNHLRIGYVSSTETLKEGLALMGPFLESWQKQRVE